MKKIVVFDLETKLRPGKPEEIAAGKSDCLWSEKDKMGISVGCAFSYATGEYTVHLDDNLADLWQMLHEADLVTGYNIEAFDLPLLLAEMQNVVRRRPEVFKNPDEILARMKEQYDAIVAKSFDMFPAIKAAAKSDKYAAGFRVDDVLLHTFGRESMKTGNGAFAPDLYKQGKMGELISYCLGDVHRERRIFERMAVVGRVRAMGHRAGQEDILTPPVPGLNWPALDLPHRMDAPMTDEARAEFRELMKEPPPPPARTAEDVLVDAGVLPPGGGVHVPAKDLASEAI